jgi:hypothetical protein
LRAVILFATAFALTGVALRFGLATFLFAGFDFAVEREVTLSAFLAGAFAPEVFLVSDFGRADFVLSVLPLPAGLDVDRLDAARRTPFVTGLLIGTPYRVQT